MFTNEYVMDRKRYDMWATPKFWRNPFFGIYVILFIAGIFAWWYFDREDVSARWKTIGAFLTFVAIYRGVFFKWMYADKTFRLQRQRYFGNKNWTCKIIIKEERILLYINNKLNNKVEWQEIIAFKEAKSYFKLATDEYNEGVRLDKACFTRGDADSFRQWILDNHPEIPYGMEDKRFNR